MAHDTKTAVVSRNGAVDSILARANGGKFRVYDGAKPTDSDTAVGAQVLLAEFTLPNPAAAAASGGTGVLNNIAAVNALATTATGASWGRFVTSAGAAIYDVTVGEAADNADVTINNKMIQSGAQVSVTNGQLSYTLPA